MTCRPGTQTQTPTTAAPAVATVTRTPTPCRATPLPPATSPRPNPKAPSPRNHSRQGPPASRRRPLTLVRIPSARPPPAPAPAGVSSHSRKEFSQMTDHASPALTTRNATLPDMVAILRHQRARRLDVVAPAAAIHAHEGNLIISNTVQQMTEVGVTSAAGTYRPTKVADEGISAKLGINLAYLRKLRDERPDLWDANVNGWLHGDQLAGIPPDNRQFLLRLFQAEGDNLGVARALLSDSYKVIDNLDALMATLDGIRQAGTEVEFDGLA